MEKRYVSQLVNGNLVVFTRPAYMHMELGDFLIKSGFTKFSVDSRTGIIEMEYTNGFKYELEPCDMDDYYKGVTLLLIKREA